ncbi:GAF domain-containing sensor histidine kinase [Roseovarius confluentis]|uniref:GAF domain-containing sensor histidine kinase n=1 Tax=Roseovarius confluentis TaxID=1852027 RepID=UPI003BAD767C
MARPEILFPFASNEHARLREVHEVVDPKRRGEAFVQKVAERAAEIFGTPAALVSIVEADHQWFLGKTGIDLESTPRDYSICSRAIMSDRPLMLPDTLEHAEFRTHPAVTQSPNVRFYAGAPIVLSSGFRVGTVCAIDVAPHAAPSEEAISELQSLAAEVVTHLETQHAARSFGDRSARQEIMNDAQQEFLALIGHEFRSPLTVLLGNAKLLQANVAGELEMEPEQRKQFSERAISAVISSGEHLHRLIERVLQFTQLQNGELILAEDNFPCAAFLESVAAPIEPMITAAQREVDTYCSPEVGTIRADGEQLFLALSSLLANATSHGEGEIELFSALADDQSLRLVCSDEGPGCSEEQVNRSDRPFAIGENVDTRKVGGLGLGLPLAKKIAQLHGGKLQRGKDELRSWVELVLPAWRCSPMYST